jgi:Zn-dependent protease
MYRSVYRLPFRLLRIPVQLDLTFLLVLPLLAWLIGSDLGKFVRAFELEIQVEPLLEGFKPYLLGFFAALGLFLSILVHELGHSLIGRHFNLRIKNITLWVLGGMAEFERIPKQRGTEALMAIAGPITSILMAGLAWGLQQATPLSFGGMRFILSYLIYMNLVLAVFNLLPALPLDGGRVFRSLLAMRIAYRKATLIAATLSRILAAILGLVGLLSLNLWLMLIAFFIFIAVSGETRATAPQPVESIHDRD